MTAKNPNAAYVCINQGQAVCPQEIERQSVCINADIGQVLPKACLMPQSSRRLSQQKADVSHHRVYAKPL